MKKTALSVLIALSVPSIALAHTPLFSCYDFGDNTILCEGGFSDGSSAAGVEMLVLDGSDKEIIKSEMSEDGEFEFQKPEGTYKVIFNAGPGHALEIKGEDIVE
ncbi:hypothetical protein [Vibrio panuliri]|uniref:SD-repeat containing protein B domain-containing protein n=1 Tax=Vibrio panuliri TaxID=1381081 RepID=A0A1Q9HQA7_9VIBR|nr:hypothetical protein [Vibrio panuliri]KAB1457925.1 hypothetical protein F7O85_09395 [Vibrio panuliri]OLQ93051.1 hypothetical protein BIY22_00740 [Vibrio panuliri]OLQ95626.1 hypothetical protein BIY20_06180 [Vibrio panuliri]